MPNTAPNTSWFKITTAGGMDTARAVREVSPRTRIVVLTDEGDDRIVAAAKFVGAHDFIGDLRHQRHEPPQQVDCLGAREVTLELDQVGGHEEVPVVILDLRLKHLDALARELMQPYFSECQACLHDGVVENADLLDAGMVGFGGLEDVRFRDPVIPGSRLILLSQLLKARRGRCCGTASREPAPARSGSGRARVAALRALSARESYGKVVLEP